jgi:anaerobic selenocysteine-containing dehydrogenase
MDLAMEMGYAEDWWNGDMDACQNEQIRRTRMTIQELREQYPTGKIYPPMERANVGDFESFFKARSTRIDKGLYLPQGKVAIYNTTFEEAGYRPLPDWTELVEGPITTPDLYKKYPLIMSDYHTCISFTAGYQRDVARLREVEPWPFLHIHPETAKARGIAHHDMVIVEGKMGWMKCKAEHFPAIRRDTVMLLHGWWQGCKELGFEEMPLLDGGANANMMYETTEAAFDPLCTAMASQALVEVRKAQP